MHTPSRLLTLAVGLNFCSLKRADAAVLTESGFLTETSISRSADAQLAPRKNLSEASPMDRLLLLIVLAFGLNLLFAGHADAYVPVEAEFSVKTSILDAISNALSQELTGTDFHMYQRARLGLAKGELPHPFSHAPYSRAKVCDATQSETDWLNLECRWQTMGGTSTYCSRRLCFETHIADFITRAPRLMEAVIRAVSNPCAFIPDPAEINAAAGWFKVHSPGMFHISEISVHQLRCTSERPIKGKIFKVEGSSFYRIEYVRSPVRQQQEGNHGNNSSKSIH